MKTSRGCRIDPKIIASSRDSEASLSIGHPAEPSVASRRPAGARGHRFWRSMHGWKALHSGFSAPHCSPSESQRVRRCTESQLQPNSVGSSYFTGAASWRPCLRARHGCRIDPKIIASSRCSEASLATAGHPAEPQVTSRRAAGARGHRF